MKKKLIIGLILIMGIAKASLSSEIPEGSQNNGTLPILPPSFKDEINFPQEDNQYPEDETCPYVIEEDYTLRVIDKETGEIIWEKEITAIDENGDGKPEKIDVKENNEN